MIVEFLKHASPFNAGEKINFPDDKADDLIKRGIVKAFLVAKNEEIIKDSEVIAVKKTVKKAAQ